MKRIGIFLTVLFFACGLSAQSPKSYLVADFNEKNLDPLLEICRKGGLEYLLEQHPFATYGHYRWNPDFAANNKAVARMVQKAENAGVHLGVLVRRDVISENDPYYASKYSKHFLKEGKVELFSDIDEDEIDIALRINEVIKGASSLNLILVDNELVSYGTIERAGDLLLLHHCTRGACGTRKAPHSAKAEAYKIWDTPERHVAPDDVLRDSVRRQLDSRLEATGISFVLEAGEPGQEPFDGSLRVRQVERWADDKSLSDGGSLGWITLRSAEKRQNATSLDDVEWMMSKAVGFGAGYGLLMDKKVMKEHGRLDEILEKMRQWDELRHASGLTKHLLEELRDPYLDWHLEQDTIGGFLLSQWNFSRRYQCVFSVVDSLLVSTKPWEWKAEAEGRFGLRLQVEGKVPVKNPMINTEKGLVMFPCTIKPGQFLVYDFDDIALLMDANYKTIKEVPIEGISELPAGTSEATFLCEVEKEGETPEVTLRYITCAKKISVAK